MVYFLLFFFVSIFPLHAYLDPGSGSVLVSVIAALVAAAFYFLKSFFYEKIRFLFKKRSPIHKNDYGIVFYSEGGHYWPVFLPILIELSARGISCSYFTSDAEDPGLKITFAHVDPVYIGEGYEAYYILNRLSAKLVVMTTPGLDVLQLKRSKKVAHYCHIVHGLEDTSTYPPYGVDYFDSVLVNGLHQEEVIRQLETSRNSKKKRIEVIGSTYLDVMAEQLEKGLDKEETKNSTKPTILLAPSWGEKGFLSRYGESLIQALLETDFNLILRPHPQSWKSEANLLAELEKRFSGNEHLTWDKNAQGLEAMQKSNLMISDFSGIIFDYIFLFQKTVVVTDFSIDPRKFDMNALPSKSSTLMGLLKEDKIAYQLKENDSPKIDSIVKKVLSSDQYLTNIDALKNRIWCHPGESGKRGADVIEELN